MVYGIYIPSTSSSALPPGLQAPSPNHTAPSDIVGDTGARVIWERPAALGRRAGAAHFRGSHQGLQIRCWGRNYRWALTSLDVVRESVRLD